MLLQKILDHRFLPQAKITSNLGYYLIISLLFYWILIPEEAIKTVQKQIGSDEAIKQLRQELDQLKQQNQDLRSRLEDLEAKGKNSIGSVKNWVVAIDELTRRQGLN